MTEKHIKPVATPSPIIRQVFNFPQRTKYIIFAVIGMVFYCNSLGNKYAYDDGITILLNSYVQMGFSGIPKIMTNDSYASFYKNGGADPSQQLKGGRYRPLSEVIFAIEQGIFGNPDFLVFFRHLVNILAYIVCLLSIFYFLDKYLLTKIPWGSDCAFLATVLFAIHPLHTEVVANIKSLDEILSLLLIMLTFIFSLQYLKEKKNSLLVYGLVSYFFALLAKEYAVTLLFFIPLLFYLTGAKKPYDALLSTLPYLGVFCVYLVLRLNAVGFHGDLSGANNPYLHAIPIQKFATEWFFMGRYIKLLFYPYPFFYDYTYYQLTYKSMTNIFVLLSIFLYLSAFVWGIWLVVKKNVLAFPVLFFLLNLLMVSNFFLDIGAIMGERLAFHSSLGFVIILSYFLLKILSKQSFEIKKIIVLSTASILSVLCLGETVVRNAQWKDNYTLFLQIVTVAPNSCTANSNVGWYYLGKSEAKENTPTQAQAYLDSAYKYSLKATRCYNASQAAYDNLGGVYFHLGMYDSAKYCWDEAVQLSHGASHPEHYNLLMPCFYQKGLELGKQGNVYGGIHEFMKALSINDSNPDIWYNLGGAYYTIKKYDSARYAWEKTLQYRPGDMDAQRGLQAIPLSAGSKK